MKAKVRFTKPVKRGLKTMRSLVVEVIEEYSIARLAVSKMKARDQRDFNAAMAWLESIEDAMQAQTPAAEPEAVQA